MSRRPLLLGRLVVGHLVRGWVAAGRWVERGRALRRPALLRQLANPLTGLPALLFDAAGTGLVVIDRAGRVVRANAVLRDMLGPLVDLSPGAPAALVFAAAERGQSWEEVRLALAGRPSRQSFATRLEDSRAGPEAAVSASVVPLREPAAGHAGPAAVVGALLRIVDITLQRQLQGQLAQAQKLQAVGSLAGGIAHDFNNLLTAVQGAAEAVAARPGLDAETAEDVAMIRASVGRGAALVRQLLAFGRQQTLQPQVLAVNDVIADLSGLLRRLLGSRIRLEVALEQPGRLVRADPTQLDQVLVNLAVNARDAMPDGGTLTLRSGHQTLYRPMLGGAEAIPPGRYVMIEVQDTGCGIPPEVLPRIFDPFFTTRREQGGSGLGLSTVHGIVRQSGGFLDVDSTPGQGTRLRLYLPRHDGEPMAIPQAPEVGSPALGSPEVGAPPRAPVAAPVRRGVVLLVDDEEPVRRLAERALARQGWEVVSADCGEAALDRLAALPAGPARPIAAIVTDMVMPGMDGAALVRAARAQLDWPAMPALLVSGYAEASLRDALAAEPGVAFLPKPYALKQLAERLADIAVPRDVSTADQAVR